MELYQFSWGCGSDDECYSFYANMDRESIINLMISYKEAGGDLYDFDEFQNYATEHGFEIQRYYHNEPIYINEDELDELDD